MPLFAFDEDDIIDARSADPDRRYWCLDCFLPLKLRKGRYKQPHFYHIQKSPSCRLYSKSEDHLIAQLEIQRLFDQNTLFIEKPFPEIARVADLCWEEKKVIFEIQCSKITEAEVRKRISDYRSIGYEITWLLDDRVFNRRFLRPAEKYLREHSCYYLKIKNATIYDQFEIFFENRRLRKGKPLRISLKKLCIRKDSRRSDKNIPEQILKLKSLHYFFNDRLDKADRRTEVLLIYWKTLENQIQKEKKRKPFLDFFKKLLKKYEAFLDRLLKER